ncbi:MAG TPA: hypothetical protein VJL82_04045 [Rhizomicrobium sp.]|nr:hypothetical protein [Rhizomicrobium sp.]
MQVSATLIAAQQAAREARTRLQVPQAAPQTSQANFAATLGKTSGVDTGFSALPLKQTAAPPTAAAHQPQAAVPARMGQHIDITI